MHGCPDNRSPQLSPIYGWLSNVSCWPIAPVHLRPLKPTFAKTWTNSPTTAKAQTVRTALRQISDSPCRCSREDEQYAHPPQNKKQKTKNALKNTVQRFREPGHCTFDVMQFVQAE